MHKPFALLALLAGLFGGCADLPSPRINSALDPSNPSAPEASGPRFGPHLVATTRVFLNPSAEAGAQNMDHSKMKGMEGMDHSQMQGMDHSQMQGMDHSQPQGTDHSKMPGMGASSSTATTSPAMSGKAVEAEMKQTSDEMKRLSDELKAKSDAAKLAASPEQKPAAGAKSAGTVYTCPMHPEIQEAKPGQCPKCGMKLVKKPGAPEGAKP